MRSLLRYKGFKVIRLEVNPTFVSIDVSIDGIIWNDMLLQECTCGIVTTYKSSHHKPGCNQNKIPNYPQRGVDIHADRIIPYKILAIDDVRHGEYYSIRVQIGSILYKGLLLIKCTCGMYNRHSHRDCMYVKHPELIKK